ncbi:hypothetical protein AX16_001064 [Volvariella volvacea WC 439]|nr:hypothetical protein AX16_001064 [Volvariella volvacea WC 439]
MIQHTSTRAASTAIAPHQATSDGPEQWGKWAGRRHYSLEVVQHPIRARMCGFGDKDRRPLAPAAVAKMVVRADDNSIVDVDDVDCSFFLVTVDLWSADGKTEQNLVLHPSSADRYVPPHKPRRRGTSHSAQQAQSSGNQTPAPRSTPPPQFSEQSASTIPTPIIPTQPPPYNNQNYFPQPPGASEESFQPATPYNGSSVETPTWGYTSQTSPVDRNSAYPPSVLPSVRRTSTSSAPNVNSAASDNWQTSPADSEIPYRPWGNDAPYPSTDGSLEQHPDPSQRGSNTEGRENPGWTQNEQSSQNRYSQDNAYAPGSSNNQTDQSVYSPAPHAQVSQPAYFTSPYPPPANAGPSTGPYGRPVFTRTLVGPLSSNACRLLDEHRKPGIFFLFQDLSVRTEGAFRLRMRLMNVGAPPAPERGALRVHNDVSPVLAQTFTDPFIVYSAKKFPGVPATTALSIAFGSQGQKLPLRGRHGNKRRRQGDSESDEDSDG